MSRTIKTNSGSEFLVNISGAKLIGCLLKEVGAKHYADLMGPDMPYDMTEEEAADAAASLTQFLDRERYFRFYNKHKHFFGADASISDFVIFVEKMIRDLRDSEGYECL
jgi:hypothetical protein